MEINVLASGSSGNAYHITDGGHSLLIEAGIAWPLIRQKLNFQTSALVGCLISHEHGDHAKAVKEAMASGIDCYMSKGTADALNIGGHRLKVLQPKTPVEVGSFTVLPFAVRHDAAEPFGYLVAGVSGDKLLYITDSAYSRYRFDGLTHVMVECNYSLPILDSNVIAGVISADLRNRIVTNHFGLENVVRFLKANRLWRCREIYLLHLSSKNSDASAFQRTVAEVTGLPVYIA